MKRLLALLLVLVMLATMLVACKGDGNNDNNGDGTPCAKCVDADLNGKCDVCGSEVTTEITDAAGAAMTSAVKAQLKAAKSMKIEFALSFLQTVVNTRTYTNEYSEAKASFVVVLSRTETGVNAKVDVKTETKDEADEPYTTHEGTVLYLVDGVLYSNFGDPAEPFSKLDLNPLFNPDSNAEGMITAFGTLAQMLQGVIDQLGEVEITEAQLAELGTAILKALNVSNNRGELVLDAKPTIDSFKAYVTGLDLNTKTVEELLNDALALIDAELTVESILAAIEEAGTMTVGEAILAIDEFLAENADTSLQAIYDKIVANEQVKTMVQMLLGIGDESWNNDVKGFKFAEISDEIKGMTVYDFVMQMVELFLPHSETAPEDPDLIPTPYGEEDELSYTSLTDLLASVRAMLDITLSDLEQQVLGIPLFTQLRQFADAITVDAMNAKVGVAFKGLFLIDAITLEANVDLTVTSFLYTEGNTPTGSETTHAVFALTAKISEISTEAITVTAPTNVKAGG